MTYPTIEHGKFVWQGGAFAFNLVKKLINI